jgi:Domain of unknown function (DUF4465)/PEP-CTERM motif
MIRPTRLFTICFLPTIVLALASLAAAADETVDFNDLSLADGNPSYSGSGGVTSDVTGYYFNGPTANSTAVNNMEQLSGDNGLVGTFSSGSPAPIVFGNISDTSDPNSPGYPGNWAGFGYSNVNDTTDPGYTNQFAAYPGVGAGAGLNGAPDNYAIGFGYLNANANQAQPFAFNTANPDPSQLALLPQFQIPSGYQIQSLEVTNTTYDVLSFLEGGGGAKVFGPGDWYQLTIYGTNAQGQVLPNQYDYYLANFQNGNSTIIESWQTLSLASTLSGATTLYFNVTSTDNGPYGMNTPGYFALDNIVIQPVPEPSSLALLATAACGLAAIAWRRRRGAQR